MEIIKIKTSKKEEIIDITDKINSIVKDMKEGFINIYVKHATAAIIINENYDPNIQIDFLAMLNDIIPQGKWLHDKIDNNGAAHLKSSLIGPSETIPIKDGKLQLGTWQSVMLCEFDGPREREIIIQRCHAKTAKQDQ